MAKVTIKGIVSAATILEGKKHSINVADGMEFFARVRDVTRDLDEEDWGVVHRYLRPGKRYKGWANQPIKSVLGVSIRKSSTWPTVTKPKRRARPGGKRKGKG